MPKPSVNFKHQEALDWLSDISESNSVLSAILSVIHPSLYSAGREAVIRLRQNAEIHPLGNVLDKWNTVFSGLSIICNRTTPVHRDTQSRSHWYDLLTALGPYQNCNLGLPGLGISLEYGPGTVVGLSGKVLEHQVLSYEGERVCYAYFMRSNVLEWAGVDGGSWMKTDHYDIVDVVQTTSMS